MDTIGSWFGKKKEERTSIYTQGHENKKINPVFLLFLECLASVVHQNPTSFEFKSSYLAFIGTELHTNRFWEFVQSNSQDASQLPSVFASDFRRPHVNKIFEKDDQGLLQYNPIHLTYWHDYFSRFAKKRLPNVAPKSVSLEYLNGEKTKLTEQIIEQLQICKDRQEAMSEEQRAEFDQCQALLKELAGQSL